jgi:response regulator RpfG family c-di-GMP phosphodiesterase
MTNEVIINVLYVDDEVHNLQAFKAVFRRKFNVFIANSASEAEIILAKNDIHVLITDQRMPAKSGTQLLAETTKKYPDQIRILLTAFADINCMDDAVKKGYVYRILKKPWNENTLQEAIEEGLKYLI